MPSPKVKEFSKKYFTYHQTDPKLSAEIKQELEKLGACKPYYADNDDERAILLIDMWGSTNEEVKNIVRLETGKYLGEVIDKDNFLTEMHQKLQKKREIMKNLRKKN